jgi:hypothetical protein
MKKFTLFIAIGFLFLARLAAASPNDPVVVGLQLAQIDFDVVHATLIERCKASSPDAVPALVTAISNWKTKNAAALQQLHVMSRNNLVKILKMSEADANSQMARTTELVTAGLKEQFEQVPEPELKAACAGQYASQTLVNPLFDFNALLAKMLVGNSVP